MLGTSKQEKLFYEAILQIVNKDNMAAISEDGQLAAKVLDEYMTDFQNGNSNLHVFSAHLHMDEATPYLHIDFVPLGICWAGIKTSVRNEMHDKNERWGL